MTTAPADVFAVDFAMLAREVAMDILPLTDVLKLHQISSEDWATIQENPRFKQMFEQMVREWNSAASTRERVRIKAATGLESQLEGLIAALSDESIPYTQRIEGGKFLARIGEIDAATLHEGAGGAPFAININIGAGVPAVSAITGVRDTPVTIEAHPVIPEPAR